MVITPAIDQNPASRIRIAFCITELDAGGAEQALTNLVLGLPREDWEPRVYALGSWGPFASTLRDAGVPVTCYDAWHWWDSPRVLWRLTRDLRSFRPELLQTFLFHANIFGRLAGWRAGVPHILSGQRVAERRSRIYGWIDRLTNGLVERNVCVSRGVADHLEREVGCSPAKTVVIPNGVDAVRYSHAAPMDWTQLGLPADACVLISIGRLEPQKGIDTLLRCLPDVLPAFPRAHAVIVGDGPDRAALEQLVSDGELSGRVHFLGRRNDVPQLLAGAVALVLPSRWEGMPNVVLEAMAAGKAVIATQVEGVTELIEHGATGWLVPPENPAALTERLRTLLADPASAVTAGAAAQNSIQERFTIPAMVARYVELYRELLSLHAETSAPRPSNEKI